jgi:hypothetical protein
MAEFGTPAFNDLWRQRGFFAALDSSPRHGQASVESMRAMNCGVVREKIPQIRKELARLATVVDRLDHHTLAGSTGGRVEHLHFERDVVELAGWIASLLESYGGFEYYLSEPGFQKVNGWMKKWGEALENHGSRMG